MVFVDNANDLMELLVRVLFGHDTIAAQDVKTFHILYSESSSGGLSSAWRLESQWCYARTPPSLTPPVRVRVSH